MTDQASADPRPLTGEPLPLDLVNTRWLEAGALERDLLDDPATATAWARSHGHEGEVGSAELRSLRGARAAIADLVTARDDVPAKAYAALDAILQRGHVAERLGPNGVEARVEVDAPEHELAWRAAHGLLELLRAHPERVRQCDAHDCILVFHDDSRTGRRRWCSMQTCGNRAKARRHQARAHEG